MRSKNVYRFPFFGNINPAKAPFHDETKWQQYALDFPMPEGTPIIAAYDGLVAEIKDGLTEGGPYKELLGKCNHVILAHENGEFTDYVHLKKGLEVREKHHVREGDLLGYSGLTGYTTYPHLHFAVYVLKGNHFQTVVPRFRKYGKVIALRSPVR